MLPKLFLVTVFVTVTESKLELGFSNLISWFHLGCLLSTNSRNNPVTFPLVFYRFCGNRRLPRTMGRLNVSGHAI